MTFLALVLLSLATYRVVRLWLYDSLLEGARQWTWGKLRGHTGWRGFILKLITCQWCLGVHVALWFTLLWITCIVGWRGWSSIGIFAVTWPAIAALQSWCHAIEDRLFGTE